MPIRSPDVNEAARRPGGDTLALADFDPATGDRDDASRPAPALRTPAGWPLTPTRSRVPAGWPVTPTPVTGTASYGPSPQ